MTTSIAFIHAPQRPERVESLARIKKQLGLEDNAAALPAGIVSVTTIAERGAEVPEYARKDDPSMPTHLAVPNHVWAQKFYAWAQEQSADDILMLQDDVILPDNFLAILKAVRQGVGEGETLSLFTIGAWAKSLYDKGARLVSTADWMPGPCRLVSRARLAEHFRWIHEGVRLGCKEAINEDTLLGLSHAAHGWRIYNPLPAIADHDATLASNYGNGKAAHNKASFSWTSLTPDEQAALADPAYWVRKNPIPNCPGGDVPHLGTMYSFTARDYCRWVMPPVRANGSYDHDAWAKRADEIHADTVAVDGRRLWVA
jgi:hypothetical protein